MDGEDYYIQDALVLYQTVICSFVFLSLVSRYYQKRIAPRKRRCVRTDISYNVAERICTQVNHLHRIIDASDVQCVVNLRMCRNAFGRLCYLVRHVSGVLDSRYVRVEEKVAMFLSILAHHKKNRIIGHDYLRSGHTVSTHFHEVLKAILMLNTILLAKPIPVDETCTHEPWKWFKGCLGALYGTYINVHVPIMDKPKYRTRKGTIAVNVLGVCDRDMKFVYALTGWEGSAADARVLRDSMNRQDGLKIPRVSPISLFTLTTSCYYLCDNGYGNVEGFLTPYRRTRYHINDWVNSNSGPQNYKEYFNSKHCRARNVIERAFGLMKKRWAVLRSPTFYPLQVQNHMILACMLLHNFIRSEMPDDPLEEFEDASGACNEETEDEFIENMESSVAWDMWRDHLAMSMYHN